MPPPPSQQTWTLEISGSRIASLIAVALAWLFGLGAFALFHYGTGGSPLVVSMLTTLSFPAVITWYGFKSAFLGAGRVRIDRTGFTISRGRTAERHAWTNVERFYVDRFGANEHHPGHPVPHFLLRDGTVQWLPGNAGLDAAQFVALMGRLKTLAAQGWPRLPRSVADVLRDDDTETRP